MGIDERKWEEKQGLNADVYERDGLVIIQTLSGRGLLGSDPMVDPVVVSSVAPDEVLGSELVGALSRSRFLSEEEASARFAPDRLEEYDAAWRARVAAKIPGGSEFDLGTGLKCCGVALTHGEVTLAPMRQEGTAMWEALGPESEVKVSERSPAFVVGAAVREALRRCS